MGALDGIRESADNAPVSRKDESDPIILALPDMWRSHSTSLHDADPHKVP